MKFLAASVCLAVFVVGVSCFVKALPRHDPECPAEDGPFPVFVPHETDCTLYYECSQGYKILMVCGLGLHWNSGKNVCDYPEVPGCQQ